VSHFLRAGFLWDSIRQIRQEADLLKKLIGDLRASEDENNGLFESEASEEKVPYSKIGDAVERIICSCKEVQELIDSLQCEPLVYTGDGDTDEVIHMLDGLIFKAKSVQADHNEQDSLNQKGKCKGSILKDATGSAS
jgi:hypothetical protein